VDGCRLPPDSYGRRHEPLNLSRPLPTMTLEPGLRRSSSPHRRRLASRTGQMPGPGYQKSSRPLESNAPLIGLTLPERLGGRTRRLQWETSVCMKLLAAAVILPATIVIGIAALETRIFFPLPSNPPTKGIVWGGHTFASQQDFGRWLRSRGFRYAVWARRHPFLTGVEATPSPQRTAQRRAAARVPREKSSKWSPSPEGVAGGVAVLAALGLGVAFARRRQRHGRSQSPRQWSLETARRRAPPTTEPGAQLTAHRGNAALASTMRGSAAPALLWMRRTNETIVRSLDPAAHRAAARGEAGARLTMRGVTAIGLLTIRGASATAVRSVLLARSAASFVLPNRPDLAWHLGTAFLYLVAAVGVIVWVVIMLGG
jgi:MYXO-CTERM domain-containing protein